MTRIFICSPFQGNEEFNIRYAKQYARFAYTQGFLPVAPHLYFPQFLKEMRAEERMDGIQYGLNLMQECKAVWVFGEQISEGMYLEITEATRLGIPIKYFTEENGKIVERSGN